MSRVQDKICFIRDLVISNDFAKLKFHKMTMLNLKEEIHRHVAKKTNDYNYQLDFTSQDLRELAQDIKSLLKKWETKMCPEKNIKKIQKDVIENKIFLDPFYNEVIPIMIARTENIQPLTELLNLIEYHAVFLYFLEEASNDKFALEYTERL